MEGLSKLNHPAPIHNAGWNYAVLGAAAVFEGTTWFIALREFNLKRSNADLLKAVRLSKDPATFIVLFEDTAALMGIGIAAAGLLMTDTLGLEWADGAASLLIAAVLGATAWFLAVETKSLLTGEAASPRIVNRIRAILLADAGVLAINDLKTVHLGPDDILVLASLNFRDGLTMAEVEVAVDDMENLIKGEFPTIRQLFLGARSPRTVASDKATR